VSPLAHAIISYLPRRSWTDVAIGLAPDLPNLLFVTRDEWLPESSWRVRASRVSHSPVIVALVLLLSRGKAWAYAAHWLADMLTHERKQWTWPIR
jgi:hypothetical protein